MNENFEENVKLPEALDQLGPITVRHQGWYHEEEGSSKLLCDVVWRKRRYSCPLLLPLQGIVFDEQIIEDLRSFLDELVEHEVEREWRATYLVKIESLVQKAAVRLYKKLLKAKVLPEGLRPKRVSRKTYSH